MDANVSNFMNKHGGLAIGGAKFKKPVNPTKRPMKKDGT